VAGTAIPGAVETQYPPYSQDQLSKYDHLTYAGTGGNPPITDSTLGSYYDDESFGIPAGDTTSTVTDPGGEDVQIDYDNHDVPHVYGSNDETMSFGAGYAQASERLFFMDVLRHYGEGETAAFVGSSCTDFLMDEQQLLLAPYTAAERQAQVDALPAEYGAQGVRVRAMIYAYVAGINEYIKEADQDPTNKIPVEYYALPTPSSVIPPAAGDPPVLPQPWSVGDVVAIAGLIGGIFGKGGGIEATDSALYSYLVGKLGTTEGQKAYASFKSQDDPDAPTTITDKSFPYMPQNTVPNPTKNVIPFPSSDHLVHLVDPPNTYPTGDTPCTDPSSSTTGALPVNASPLAKVQLEALGDVASLATTPAQMSNALVVDASHSSDGHPFAVFGPQVSYFAPQILMEEDLHSPTYDAEGASFPGTGVVELGRGEDYAWSATSANTDIIDERMLKTCGGDQYHYVYDGKCIAMLSENFSETALPTAGGAGLPGSVTHTIYRTADKSEIVQGWNGPASDPTEYAVATERSTYNHDVDSVIGFVAWGTPSLTYDATSWMHGATEIGFTFNWFYVDDRDIAYYSGGRDPIRPADVDPNLPLSGSGNANWQGYLPPADHPHEINPAQGYFVSWNNRGAPGFSAPDDYFGYGSTYRSTMLVTQLKAQFAAHGGKVDRADVVQAMATAATQDLDGLTEINSMLGYLKAHPNKNETATEKSMVSLLTTWVATGAHRHKAQESDTQYAQAAAVAISDELVPDLIEAVWDPLLGGPGTGQVANTGGAFDLGYLILPMQFTNSPHSGGANLGSAYDSGYEGYMLDVFKQLAGGTPGDPFDKAVTATWCGSGPSSCPTAIWGALAKAAGTLATANGGSTDAASWTADTNTAATATSTSAAETMPVYDAIHFRAIGLVATPAIDWQNRPTFQQVVEFPSHRARTGAGTTSSSSSTASEAGSTTGGSGSLAFTGGLPGALTALVLVSAGGALAAARRRRRL
jgi:acyl-homoserine lactone acylase PvdQ